MTRRRRQSVVRRKEGCEYTFEDHGRSVRLFRKVKLIVSLLVACIPLTEFIPALGPAAHAQSVSYAYDADGRLSAVSDGSNNVAGYEYDQLGNLLAISRNTGVGFGAVPSSGPIGTQVTLYGIGFSATTSQNAVKFNGISASVSSATTTKLVVTVPSGASTGPISVTSPSGSGNSGTFNFQVQ
jgi:YD repeat-containing protein